MNRLWVSEVSVVSFVGTFSVQLQRVLSFVFLSGFQLCCADQFLRFCCYFFIHLFSVFALGLIESHPSSILPLKVLVSRLNGVLVSFTRSYYQIWSRSDWLSLPSNRFQIELVSIHPTLAFLTFMCSLKRIRLAIIWKHKFQIPKSTNIKKGQKDHKLYGFPSMSVQFSFQVLDQYLQFDCYGQHNLILAL